MYPCEECDDRFFNPYLGREGECIDTNEHDIIHEFYTATLGEKWNISPKWDLDSKHYCGYTGITCDNNNNVVGINLKASGLKGTIPESLGFLRFLVNLDLSDNDLTGFLPSDLRWAPLETLDITGNRLRGIVPPILCRSQGINGNGDNGEFSCDSIACGVGFYTKTGLGNRLPDGGMYCDPCIYDTFLGSKECIPPVVTSVRTFSNDDRNAFEAFFLTIISVSSLLVFVYAVIRARRYYIYLKTRGDLIKQVEEEELDVGDYI